MPTSERGRDEVEPEMNQRSSAMTARRKTRFVVRSGRTGIGCDEGSEEGRDKEKRMAGGAKRERVPVPVLCAGQYHIHLKSWKALKIPVRAMLAVFQNVPDQIEVLVFLMLMRQTIPVGQFAPFYFCHFLATTGECFESALIEQIPYEKRVRYLGALVAALNLLSEGGPALRSLEILLLLGREQKSKFRDFS